MHYSGLVAKLMVRGFDYLTEGFERKSDIKIFTLDQIDEIEDFLGGGIKIGHSRFTSGKDFELTDEERYFIKNVRRFEHDYFKS